MPKLDHETRDKTPPVWDMSQERVLMEQLVGQRLNFFLVFFAVIIAGAVNAREQFQLQLVLTIGLMVSMVLLAAINRTSARLDVALSILRQDPTHPYTIIGDQVGGFSVRFLLWRLLPAFCVALLALGCAAAWANVLSASDRSILRPVTFSQGK